MCQYIMALIHIYIDIYTHAAIALNDIRKRLKPL